MDAYVPPTADHAPPVPVAARASLCVTRADGNADEVVDGMGGHEDPRGNAAAATASVESRSEQRKATTSAMSSGVAKRPRGILASWRVSSASRSPSEAVWSASPPGATHRGEAVAPGATGLTSTPDVAQASAKT